MKTLTLSVLAGGALALSCLAPMAVVRAQDEPPPAAHSPDQGNWTLRQREDWLTSHLDHDEDQMRHHQDGQLTDNETADLEGRLDHVAHQIHWLHEHSFTPPW
jgi:hypothetical protein